jgi:chromate transporter
MQPVIEVLFVFLRLGLTSFGGPVAHLGFFHDEFVKKRKWIKEHEYADLVSLCQFLPGPASSQVGMAIGLSRAGVVGAIAAWVGFTIPSAALLVGFAALLLRMNEAQFQSAFAASAIHGLKLAAVAVVAQAIWSMGRALCPDLKRITLAMLAAATLVTIGSLSASWLALAPLVLILLGGLYGFWCLHGEAALPEIEMQKRVQVSKPAGAVILAFAGLLFVGLPLLAKFAHSEFLKMIGGFYRAGAMVFGGGHVVLPLLQAEVVPQGWVSKDLFLSGYGAAQAIPGPLFSFSAFLGSVSTVSPGILVGSSLALVAAFLPAFLLIVGILPFWQSLRKRKGMRRAMLGINAVVVGILIAAFYDPIWTESVRNPKDFAIAIVAFSALLIWKRPSWLVVVLTSFATSILLT